MDSSEAEVEASASETFLPTNSRNADDAKARMDPSFISLLVLAKTFLEEIFLVLLLLLLLQNPTGKKLLFLLQQP